MSVLRNTNGEITLEPRKLLLLFAKNLWVIALSSAVLCGVFYMANPFLEDPVYQATVTMYVNNSASEGGETIITASDISVSESLVDVYAAVVSSNKVLSQVIERDAPNLSVQELNNMIRVEAVNNTSLFKIHVTSKDQEHVADLANDIGNSVITQVSQIVEGSSAKVVDIATKPTSQSNSGAKAWGKVGMLIGIVLSTAIILIREVFNHTIETEEDLQEFGLPVLGCIPTTRKKNKTYFSRGSIE